jgi:hypothetical protein
MGAIPGAPSGRLIHDARAPMGSTRGRTGCQAVSVAGVVLFAVGALVLAPTVTRTAR